MIADRCESLQHVLGSPLDRIALAPFPLAPARLGGILHPLFSLTFPPQSDSSCIRVVLVPFCVTAPLLFLRLRNSATVRDVSTNGGRLVASPHSLSILFFSSLGSSYSSHLRSLRTTQACGVHPVCDLLVSLVSSVRILYVSPPCVSVHMGTWIPCPFAIRTPGVVSEQVRQPDGFLIRKWRCIHGEAEQMVMFV